MVPGARGVTNRNTKETNIVQKAAFSAIRDTNCRETTQGRKLEG